MSLHDKTEYSNNNLSLIIGGLALTCTALNWAFKPAAQPERPVTSQAAHTVRVSVPVAAQVPLLTASAPRR